MQERGRDTVEQNVTDGECYVEYNSRESSETNRCEEVDGKACVLGIISRQKALK